MANPLALGPGSCSGALWRPDSQQENIRTFVDPQNPQQVVSRMDVPDMEAFTNAMQDEGAAAAMA
jgi:hypothetical protein